MIARMKKDLVFLYKQVLPGEMEASNDKDKKDLVDFLKKIEGQTIELIFTGGDAFEKEDNNYWLPDSLWEPLDNREESD